MVDEKSEEAGATVHKIDRKPVAAGSEAAPGAAPPSGNLGAVRDGVEEKNAEKSDELGAKTAAASSAEKTEQTQHPTSINIDQAKPQDFEGEIETTNDIPSLAVIRKIDDYIVLDKHGKSHTFKSLYNGTNVARRVLVIFVRHFFCGNCQEYLRTLSDAITPESLLRLPVSTFLIIIGCGDPELIDFYAEATGCQFPIYTDPRRSLFVELGMTTTWDMGAKPTYMRRSMGSSVIASITQGLRSIPTGNVFKSGNFKQVGGEFLFEPPDLATPVTTPQDERRIDGVRVGGSTEGEDEGWVEPKRVTWCHRMRTTRDHAEIPELMDILGLEKASLSVEDQQKWDEALRTKKGTGSSMARQMSELSQATG